MQLMAAQRMSEIHTLFFQRTGLLKLEIRHLVRVVICPLSNEQGPALQYRTLSNFKPNIGDAREELVAVTSMPITLWVWILGPLPYRREALSLRLMCVRCRAGACVKVRPGEGDAHGESIPSLLASGSSPK